MPHSSLLVLPTPLQDEETAFWLMVVLLERLLYPNTYSETLEGCQVGMERGGWKWGRIHLTQREPCTPTPCLR